MSSDELSVVTGAFGYTGAYIARRLLADRVQVKTLTGHRASRDPFGGRVAVLPLDFGDLGALTRSLAGASILYNTYWIRFARGPLTFDKAVQNSRVLLRAAMDAGVQRIVHVSITNASASSSLPYFRGKALVEEAVRESGISYAIVRPTLVFGREDVLLNNIAWSIRRFPFFPMFGSGEYRVRPVFVDDVARIAVSAGHSRDNSETDAVGPETFTFEELVRLLADGVGRKVMIVHTRPALALALTSLAGVFVRDVVLTRDEVDGLMAELLYTGGPPTGETRLTDWLAENAGLLGRTYRSELRRHYR